MVMETPIPESIITHKDLMRAKKDWEFVKPILLKNDSFTDPEIAFKVMIRCHGVDWVAKILIEEGIREVDVMFPIKLMSALKYLNHTKHIVCH